MIDLIRKRHEGESWCVFTELANATGSRVRGWADAAALGLWPSRGYELHGYEVKISREDLKKELRDPAKADNIGRYCHYWWLRLADEKLMDGLVIPSTWGILAPRDGVLRSVRKAPKNAKAKPFDAPFVAAMIRNVTKSWVPKHVHDELKESTHAKVRAQLEKERRYGQEDAVRDRDELLKRIADFEKASGVEIGRYQSGNIGEALKLALDARHATGRHALERSIATLQNTSDLYDRVATQARDAIAALRTIAKADPPPPPPSPSLELPAEPGS